MDAECEMTNADRRADRPRSVPLRRFVASSLRRSAAIVWHPAPDAARRGRRRSAFTLVEMLVVAG
ncbi:MAG: hypothetical protein ACPMAQ_14295, partial [Phycisphaerae bacterium]